MFLIETDYIKENTTDISILSKQDWKDFDKLLFNDGGKTFAKHYDDPICRTLFFDKGFITFRINYKEKYCHILVLCKKKEGKVNWKVWQEKFWDFLRFNGIKKVKMNTELDVKFWEKNYGFTLKRYEMEKKL